MTWQRPDTDPLTVEPEPVRRATRSAGDRGYIDGHAGLAIVVLAIALPLALLVVLAGVALVTAPRSAPSPTAPHPSESTVLAWLDPRDLSAVGASGSEPSGAPQQADGAPLTLDGPGIGATGAAPALQRSGWATFYDEGPGLYGAVPSWRWGEEPYDVQVCAFEGGRTNCVIVLVRDFCACGNRRGIPTVIDLSPTAFRSLAPLSRGVIRVQVDGVRQRGDRPTGPPTDIEGAR